MSFLQRSNVEIRRDLAKMSDDDKISLIQQYPELLDRGIKPRLVRKYSISEILRLNAALNSRLGDFYPGIRDKFIVDTESDPRFTNYFVREDSEEKDLDLNNYPMFEDNEWDDSDYNCSQKHDEYHQICDSVWNEKCSPDNSPEENARIKELALECGKKRLRWIRTCETNPGSHIGSLEKMKHKLESCESGGSIRLKNLHLVVDGIFHQIPQPIPKLLKILLTAIALKSKCADPNVVTNLLQPYIIETPPIEDWDKYFYIAIPEYHYLTDEELMERIPVILDCLLKETFKTGNLKLRRLIRRWEDE